MSYRADSIIQGLDVLGMTPRRTGGSVAAVRQAVSPMAAAPGAVRAGTLFSAPVDPRLAAMATVPSDGGTAGPRTKMRTAPPKKTIKNLAAKKSAASRAIAAGSRLARHRRGHAGARLVSLGRKAQAKTQVKGWSEILGDWGIATLAVQSEINWEASLNGLAQAAEIAANVLAIADQVKPLSADLANKGYSISDQAQGIIDNKGGDALFDSFDNSIPSDVANVSSQAQTWTAQAQALLAGAAPPAGGAAPPPTDGGSAGGGGDSGGGGGGGDTGGGAGDGGAPMDDGGGGAPGDENVDWGENTRDQQPDDGRGGSGDLGPPTPMPEIDQVPTEEEQLPQTQEDAQAGGLKPGDKVTSLTNPAKGDGTVQLVVVDAADVQWPDGTVTSEPVDSLQPVVEQVMGNTYLHGLDVLMGDAAAYGPSIGPEPVYTDRPTIMAAQQALTARGLSPGPVDGIFGPQTEAALFKLSGKHGPPDAATLAMLGLKPGGASTGGGQGVLSSAMSSGLDWLKRTLSSGGPAPKPAAKSRAASAPTGVPQTTALVPTTAAPSWWMEPAWQGAPVKRWQAGTAAGGALAIITGIVLAARR